MEEIKLPPHNLEAEQSVLGALLIDSEAAPVVTAILQPQHFYRESHRQIYEVMLHLYSKNEPIDLITVSDALAQRDLLEQIGGLPYLTLLANLVPSSAVAGQYAQIIRNKAILRELIAASQQISAACYQQEDVATVLEGAEQLIFRLSQSRVQRDFQSMSEIIAEVYEQIAQMVQNKGSVSGLPTGFKELDELTSGLQPSDLIIIAARPSVGKTAFSLNITQNVAIRQGKPVAFFSLEMSKDQLAMRMLCCEARVDGQKVRSGFLDANDWAKISEASDILSEAPIFIDDTPAISVMEMRSKARRLKLEHDISLIVVDYLQLMRSRGRAESRQQEVAEITRSLKALARELQVPVIALSQLSRRAEDREGKRPTLADLRESGEIEQAADLVAFLYREDYYDQDTANRNIVEVIIGKHRNGPVGTVKLTNLRHIGLFSNLAPEHAEAPGA
ncbi:MAG: replicative DNA helicase [Firmicutes bacterium]|nr:replicative DNA helicase [Bacillota bacterium]